MSSRISEMQFSDVCALFRNKLAVEGGLAMIPNRAGSTALENGLRVRVYTSTGFISISKTRPSMLHSPTGIAFFTRFVPPHTIFTIFGTEEFSFPPLHALPYSNATSNFESESETRAICQRDLFKETSTENLGIADFHDRDTTHSPRDDGWCPWKNLLIISATQHGTT